MKTYLSKLNPSERRFVVGVALVFFLVINIFWVWPHFSDWSDLQRRLSAARSDLTLRETTIQQGERLKPEINKMLSASADVPPEDQAVQFLRTIQTQAAQSGVGVTGNGRLVTRTNQFFIEQIQTITVQSGEKQLVDFLYNLGQGNSLVRVRDLSLRPDQARQQLAASITLIASFQKTSKAATAPAPKNSTAPVPAAAPIKAPVTAATTNSKPATPKIK